MVRCFHCPLTGSSRATKRPALGSQATVVSKVCRPTPMMACTSRRTTRRIASWKADTIMSLPVRRHVKPTLGIDWEIERVAFRRLHRREERQLKAEVIPVRLSCRLSVTG